MKEDDLPYCDPCMTREQMLEVHRLRSRFYRRPMYTQGRVLEWDATKGFDTPPTVRDRRVSLTYYGSEFERFVSRYDARTDTISISANCPHKRAIWWHEQGHRIIDKLAGGVPIRRRHTVREEMRADDIACAVLGPKRVLKALGWAYGDSKSGYGRRQLMKRMHHIQQRG